MASPFVSLYGRLGYFSRADRSLIGTLAGRHRASRRQPAPVAKGTRGLRPERPRQCRRIRIVRTPFQRLLPLVALLGQLPARPAVRPVEELVPGRAVSRIVRGTDTHPYEVSAEAGNLLQIAVEQEGIECAGINRHVVGDERALQERRSDSILTSSLAPLVARRQAKRRQRHRWAGRSSSENLDQAVLWVIGGKPSCGSNTITREIFGLRAN